MTRPKLILPQPSRRSFLHRSAQAMLLGGALGLAGKPARATATGARSLMLDHTHTRERIDLVYASGEHYLPQALGTLNHFLRDHYSDEVGQIDPHLFDLLLNVRQVLGGGVALS